MVMLIGSVYDAAFNRRTVAGVGIDMLGEKNEYEKFTIPYFPLAAASADTIEVVIFSSQLLTMALDSKLYIDDLSLVGQNGIAIPLMLSKSIGWQCDIIVIVCRTCRGGVLQCVGTKSIVAKNVC